jgi:hypothetical protein
MGEGAVLKSITKQAISTASLKSSVVHVNFSASDDATEGRKIRTVEPVALVDGHDDIDQILNRLREEMAKYL